MKTTRLHTFEEVLTSGIHIDGQIEPVRVSRIFIPKIQRSYAQGRIEELDISTDFLHEIFKTLSSDQSTPLELSFLFGSKQSLIDGDPNGFELLDGQQRTTTLFLLYWYLYKRETTTLPEFLTRFTYETRDTSTQFLSKITNAKEGINIIEAEKPSITLRSRKWFTDDFNCDATICAMLNMLDDIHLIYNTYSQNGQKNLLCKLNKLKFYVLLLEKFDMNDELYIKMNSRGLSLSPFENFKASIVKYMKAPIHNGLYGSDDSINKEAPFWLDFISNIDAKWIDIFWVNPIQQKDSTPIDSIIDIDDTNIGNRYFRFFNRYFFTKAALHEGVKQKKLTPLPAFFYNDAESEQMELRLKGWNYYEELFEILAASPSAHTHPTFGPIEKILNILHEHYNFILSEIRKFSYGHGNSKDEFDVRNRNITIVHRVLFAAVTEFIEAMPDNLDFANPIVKGNFRKMLRVVHNIIENTPIENTVTLVGVLNAVHEIISLPGATEADFYYSLATAEKIRSENKQLAEEVEKAKEMFDQSGNYDQTWEDAFKEAENHPFFKGAIRFFFSTKVGSSRDFIKRYDIIKDLFDDKGITEAYRKDHILIRAILSCLNQWKATDTGQLDMSERYFTENAEKEKFLKNILLGSNSVRDMFCKYFTENYQGPIEQYLTEVVTNAKPHPSETNESFKMLFKRLINDSSSAALFDKIAEKERAQNSCFKVHDNRSYILAIPGTWYDRMVLDTERHIIIPKVVAKYDYKYSNKEQEGSLNSSVNDAWGWQIHLEKNITTPSGSWKLQLRFTEWKWLDFYIYGDDTDKICAAFNNNVLQIIDNEVKVCAIQYRYDKDIQIIFNEINNFEILAATI